MQKQSKLEKTLPIIHSMGNLIFDPVWAFNYHVSGNCEFLYIISGSVTLSIKNQRIKALPGDTLLIPRGARHRDEFDFAKELKIFMIQFSWDNEDDLFSLTSCRSLIDLPETKKESLAEIIHSFRHGFSENVPAKNDLLMRLQFCGILIKIIYLVMEQKKNSKKQADNPERQKQNFDWFTQKVKSYLENNYSRPLSLDEIAKHIRVSQYHLCRVFSKASGFTIFEYLTSLRMQKARCLLEKGDLSVSEIAYKVGFNNSNYFSKVFHRFHGDPPGSFYRKKYSFKKV